MPHDRDEVLARTDLGALADELLGARRGRGRSSTWPCPDPGHGPQSGRTPPVSVFVPANKEHQRWRCHACGAGGTAVDLVMTTQGVGFAEAIAGLAARAGMGGDDQERSMPAHVIEHRPPSERAPVRSVEEHVAACEALLWSPAGAPMRRWLDRRGLGEEVLRANRVGADPGPRSLPRPAGLPRSGPAVVLPVLDDDGRAVYLQARYLHPPGGRKYANPSAALAGPSPRLAQVRLSAPAVGRDTVLVCEGIPDALVSAQAGHRASAVLGAGLPDDRVARLLVERFGAETLVVAFDADDRGRAGAARLVEGLDAAGAGERVAVLDVPAACGDLNGWQLVAGASFEQELASALDRAASSPRPAVPRLAPEGLAEALEAIHSRHVLVEDPVLAARNLARLRRAVAGWERTGAAVGSVGRPVSRSPLDHDLDALAHRHLMGDGTGALRGDIALVRAAVAGWSTPVGGTEPGGDRAIGLRHAGAHIAPPAPGLAPELGLGIDL